MGIMDVLGHGVAVGCADIVGIAYVVSVAIGSVDIVGMGCIISGKYVC
jgi:hypothetical protein